MADKKPSKFKQWLKEWLPAITGALLVVLFLYAIGAYVFQESTKSAPRGKVFASDKQADTVVARVWVEPQSSTPSSQFRGWLALENLTDQEVSRLRFSTVSRFHSEKTKQTEVVQVESSVNRDLAASFLKSRPPKPAASLAAGARHTFWTTLQAPEAEGEYEFLLVYQWMQGQEKVQNSVFVGPIELPGKLTWFTRAGNSLYNIWKDLGLPVVLVALTFFFHQWGEASADKKKKAEDDREARRKEQERHTEQVRETMSKMLVVRHRDTKRFYLPLLSSLREMRDRVGHRDHPDWQNQVFFWTMIFLRNMKRLKEENGGFYLKTRSGENLLSDIWFVLKRAFQGTFGDNAYDSALQQFGPSEDYATFKARRSPELVSCEETFLVWLQGPVGFIEVYLPLASVFYHVLGYEANLSYLYWYGEPEKPPKLARLARELRTGPLAEFLREKKIESELKRYRRMILLDYREMKTKLAGKPARQERPTQPSVR